MTPRKALAAALKAYWDFIQKHPLISMVLSLVLAAACAGGIYLIWQQFPSLLRLPCFRGGCPG